MLGIILLLIMLSVLILLVEKKSSDTLGLVPTPKRMKYFFLGFLLAGILSVMKIATETIVRSTIWETRISTHWTDVMHAGWKFFISVLTEELIFRGITLYLLLRISKERQAILLSSALFGFYHWFSYEMFGAGIVPMLYVFAVTGLAGLCWAYAYVKSGTLLLPIGLHFGWNWISWFFTEKSPYGPGLFIRTAELPLNEVQNLSLSLAAGFAPTAIMYVILRCYFANFNKKYK